MSNKGKILFACSILCALLLAGLVIIDSLGISNIFITVMEYLALSLIIVLAIAITGLGFIRALLFYITFILSVYLLALAWMVTSLAEVIIIALAIMIMWIFMFFVIFRRAK